MPTKNLRTNFKLIHLWIPQTPTTSCHKEVPIQFLRGSVRHAQQGFEWCRVARRVYRRGSARLKTAHFLAPHG